MIDIDIEWQRRGSLIIISLPGCLSVRLSAIAHWRVMSITGRDTVEPDELTDNALTLSHAPVNGWLLTVVVMGDSPEN